MKNKKFNGLLNSKEVKIMWDVYIPYYKCPYKIGDSKTLLEPGYGNIVKCNYPNKMYRPSKCKEELCPIKIGVGIGCD